jgi:voltage-gated potassium channel
VFDIFSLVIFTIEYGVRLFLAKKKLKYALSFLGIVDLVAILPFYLSFGLDLRSVRVFRLFRILRLLKLTRYSEAMGQLSRAILSIREELILYISLTITFIYLAASGIYFFENPVQPDKFQSVFHSMWWAVATLTTVGYGDIYPVTVGGRIFTFFILMLGLGLVAVPSGLLASAFSNVKKEK